MCGIYCDDCVSVCVGDLLCLCVCGGGFTVMTVSLCVWGIYCDDCVSVCVGGDLL